MILLTRTPKEEVVSSGKAGKFLFEDTQSAIERGQKVFVLIADLPGSSGMSKLYFSSEESAKQFASNN